MGKERQERGTKREEGSGRGFCLMGCFCFMQHLALAAQPHHHGKITGCGLNKNLLDMGFLSCNIHAVISFAIGNDIT